MSTIYDALIVGGGPGGLSTALGLGRVHRTCAVISNAKFRNDGVHASHSVLSRDHTPPDQIRDIGREQIERYKNTTFVDATIEKITKTTINSHTVFVAKDDKDREWTGRTVVLAMGSKDVFPPIKGYEQNWPENIYQCLFCDGHERSSLPKGVLAIPFSSKAFQVASMAHYQSMPPGATHEHTGQPSLVTVFTNGIEPDTSDADIAKALDVAEALGIKIEKRKITQLIPTSTQRDAESSIGVNVVLEDGAELYMGFIFQQTKTELNGRHLVNQLGIEILDSPIGPYVKRNEPLGTTNVEGVFVVGDAGTMVKQVTAAMLHGVAASAGIAHLLNSQDDAAILAQYKEVKARMK